MNISGTAVQKGLPMLLTHFKKHWWKWVIVILALGFAFSGFSFESEERIIKKSPFKALPEQSIPRDCSEKYEK